jgi:hypothetical protein
VRADPFDLAFADRVFDRVGELHELGGIVDVAVALAFFAATSFVATAAGAAAAALVAIAAFAVPTRHANLLAFAAVVVLGLFLFLAIGMADGHEPFVAAALRAATALIATPRGAAGRLGVASGFGGRRGNRRGQRGDGQSHDCRYPFHI